MKWLFITLSLLLLALAAQSQNGYLMLKKKNTIHQRYYRGSAIAFYNIHGYLIEGFITKFTKDSLYIHLGSKQLVYTAFGTTIDTVHKAHYSVHVNEIKLIPANRFTLAKAGNILVKITTLAGAVVALNNIQAEQDVKNLIQVTSVGIIGLIIAKVNVFNTSKPTGYRIGKKYTLEIISF